MKKFGLLLMTLGLSACIAKMDSELLVESTSDSEEFVISNAKVFDGFAFKSDLDVWVRDGKILAMGKDLRVSEEVELIDASGKTLLPGLIDPHVHLAASGSPPWAPAIGDIDRTLTTNLAVGITSVLDMGAPLEDISEWENETELTLPQFAFAGRMHNRIGGHPSYMIDRSLSWPLNSMVKGMMVAEIEDEDDIEDSVEEHKEAGASFIKVAIDEIPIGTPKIKGELLDRLVEEAHNNDLPVVAHIGTEAEMNIGIEAGVDLFVHGPYRSSLSMQTIARLKASGIPMVMTSVVFDQIASFHAGDSEFTALETRLMDEEILASYQDRPTDLELSDPMKRWFAQSHAHREDTFKSLKNMHDFGVQVWVGSDSPNVNTVSGAAYHMEMLLWQNKAGIATKDVLAAATGKQSAWLEKYLGWKVGQILPGYDASLILADGDVESDVQNILAMSSLWVKGQKVVLEK